MLRWPLGFLSLAVLSGFIAFSGAASGAAGAAKVVFVVCLGIFTTSLISIMAGMVGGSRIRSRN